MALTVKELQLLSPLLALPSTLPSSRLLHRATALEIFHLITELFLTIYASQIPCHYRCISHSTPTLFLFDFLSHFYHSLWSSTLQHPQPVQVYKNRNNFKNIIDGQHGGGDLDLPTRNPRFDSLGQPTYYPIFSFFHNVGSIHFQFCFKYISPCFTMLGPLMLSLAMTSNFRTFHPRQSQQRLILCTHQLSNPCQGNAFLPSCDITPQFNPAYTKYLPMCIPRTPQHNCSWGTLREIHIPSPSNGLSPNFTTKPLISASLSIIPSLEPFKQLISKFVNSPPGKRSLTPTTRVGCANH